MTRYPDPETLEQLFSRFRKRRLRERSPKTIENYRIELRRLERFLGREPLLGDLRTSAIADLLQDLADKGASPHTVNKCRACFTALARYANRMRYIKGRVRIAPLRVARQKPKPWTRGELILLFDACQRETGSIADVPAGQWWHALHLVLWDTCEHIQSVLGLRWSDIDFAEGVICVPGEIRKFSNDVRYRLHPNTLRALKAISEPEREVVFPWDRSFSYLWHSYTRLREKAGLSVERRSSFGRLRLTAMKRQTSLGDHSNGQ